MLNDMKKTHKIRLGIIVLFIFILISAALVFKGDIQGWYNRTFYTPEILKEHSFIHLNTCSDPNKEKQTFFNKYIQKEGFYGLKQTRITIEGNHLQLYIYTHNGEVHGICDYTRDPFGIRRFENFDIEKVRLMYRNEDGTFQEINLSENPGTGLILEVSYEAGNVTRI